MIIAVDFDGTLCTDKFPEIGEPNKRLIDQLKLMKSQGHQLILWTCRCGEALQDAVDWCEQFELYFDKVNDNVNEIKRKYADSGRKVTADVYIDDKSVTPSDFFVWKLTNFDLFGDDIDEMP